ELRAFNKHSSTFRPKVVITLGSYTSLLLAVERRGDYRLARRIVEDVVKDWKSRLVADHNWTGGPAEKKWWELVERIGGRQWAVEMKGIADQGLKSTPEVSVS